MLMCVALGGGPVAFEYPSRRTASRRFCLPNGCFDVAVAAFALPIAFAFCLPFAVAVWLGDLRSPLYAGLRVGKDWKPFKQLKLRTMVWGADGVGIDATPADDARITPIGRLLRRWKIDELPQFINVLTGRHEHGRPAAKLPARVPDVFRDRARNPRGPAGRHRHFVDRVPGRGTHPGGAKDPDLAYHQLVRPWKSRFCLLYIEKRSLRLDIELLAITGLAAVSHRMALRALQPVLRRLGADEDLMRIARRQEPLVPHSPPGLNDIVRSVQPNPPPELEPVVG